MSSLESYALLDFGQKRKLERFGEFLVDRPAPAAIGQLFLTDHLLAFEITSIVLLVAAVGGVVLGSEKERGRP